MRRRRLNLWQRFTDTAQSVIFYAQEEARLKGETRVASEHILIGLLYDQENNGAVILKKLGIDLDDLRSIVTSSKKKPALAVDVKDMHLLSDSMRVIKFMYYEARNLGHEALGPEHILLGLIADNQGLAGRILRAYGLTVELIRANINNTENTWPPAIIRKISEELIEQLQNEQPTEPEESSYHRMANAIRLFFKRDAVII